RFHLEVTAELAGEWMQIPAYGEELERLAGEGSAAALLAQVRAAERDSAPLARELFSRWLERVVGLEATA
ncbi:MAG TPA: hypothetical protein VK538_10455, partial [Solirubrobacteraceae bacterium]|nr:hypothetical protein [Solirubrobacteraceae bacterium]